MGADVDGLNLLSPRGGGRSRKSDQSAATSGCITGIAPPASAAAVNRPTVTLGAPPVCVEPCWWPEV